MISSKLTKNQKKKFFKKLPNGFIEATVRYDDECGNGHNTFAITGHIKLGKNDESFGCLHDEIAEHFPELQKFLKWHSFNSDGPLCYIANTTYWARTKDHDNAEIGEPVAFDKRISFEGCEFSFKEPERGFFDFLDSVTDFSKIKIEAVEYSSERAVFKFTPNYTLSGFVECPEWHDCPFSEKADAEEFLSSLQKHKYYYRQIPTSWCEAVEPNLEAARNCAVAPNATLEQLQDKEWLLARLPKLIDDFRRDIEEIGFIF